MERPKTNPKILRRQLDGEWILFDPEAESIHVINEMANVVWTMCDGSRTIDEMVTEIDERYEVPDTGQVRSDVEGILASFAELGVLEPG